MGGQSWIFKSFVHINDHSARLQAFGELVVGKGKKQFVVGSRALSIPCAKVLVPVPRLDDHSGRSYKRDVIDTFDSRG